jgi:hypothetical protein
MRRAAEILGIEEIIELGWETDRLAMRAKSRCGSGSTIAFGACDRMR